MPLNKTNEELLYAVAERFNLNAEDTLALQRQIIAAEVMAGKRVVEAWMKALETTRELNEVSGFQSEEEYLLWNGWRRCGPSMPGRWIDPGKMSTRVVKQSAAVREQQKRDKGE